MPFSSKVADAQARYDAAVAAFKKARDEVTASKRDLEQAQGKSMSTEQRIANRHSARRAQVLRSNPKLRAIPNRSKRRQAVDAVLAERDRPRVWKFYLDDMTFDRVSNTRVIYRKNPERYKLYVAGLTLAGRMARANALLMGLSAQGKQELYDNARTIDLHLQSLVDVSPREVTVHYPSEWQVISSALRPEGSSPKSKGAQRLLALYQHIIRTHTVEG